MKKILLFTVLILAAVSFANCSARYKEARRTARAEKTAEYMRFVDSLVVSDNFIFQPHSFQLQPAGRNQQVMNTNFRMEYRSDYIEVNLPYYYGVTPPYRLGRLNYTLLAVEDYTVIREDGNITVRFSTSAYGSDTFTFTLTVSSATGGAELVLRSNFGPGTSYSGNILAIY